MPELKRVSFSLDAALLQRLEDLVCEDGYTNRSEFVRDMIRERLVRRQWDENREVAGTLTLIYNHEVGRLSETLTHLQHHRHNLVLATTHVHMDEHLCLEVAIMRGRAGDLHEMAALLRRQKGVLHAALSLSTTGTGLDHPRG